MKFLRQIRSELHKLSLTWLLLIIFALHPFIIGSSNYFDLNISDAKLFEKWSDKLFEIILVIIYAYFNKKDDNNLQDDTTVSKPVVRD